VKKTIRDYLEITGDPSLIPFKLHDFGYRGVSSEESAAIGGAAHLVNFKGSDTLAGILMLNAYYSPSEFPGYSIPASEHSTMTSWGEDHELDAYANMLVQYPTGMVSIVCDSYDIKNAVTNLIGKKLKDNVLGRYGVTILRPDSGDPVPVMIEVLESLEASFGVSRNAKGYKLLNPMVRVIQGEGNNPAAIRRMLDTLRWREWSADNIAFGMGGGLLQQVNRDTQQFAFKCSAIRRAGVWHDVYKTATGKASKRGRFLRNDLLEDVFRDGAVLTNPTLEEVRARAELKDEVVVPTSKG
jgi:nicotinamide phosphoribosyltransferase